MRFIGVHLRRVVLIILGLWIATYFIGGTSADPGWNINLRHTPDTSWFELHVYRGAVSMVYRKHVPWTWTQTPATDLRLIQWGPSRAHCVRGIKPTPQEAAQDGLIQSRGDYFPMAIVLPFPYLIVAVLIYGLWSVLSEVLKKRAGLCTKCGYDLRASKDRCPECGTRVPT